MCVPLDQPGCSAMAGFCPASTPDAYCIEQILCDHVPESFIFGKKSVNYAISILKIHRGYITI